MWVPGLEHSQQVQHFVQQLAENDGLKLSLYTFSATVVMCCQAQSPAPTGAATPARQRPSQRPRSSGRIQMCRSWTAGIWLQATCSSWPCCEGERIRWFLEVPPVSKNVCPCSTSTLLYFKGFYKVGLKITSIIMVSRTASSTEASKKNLRLLCNSRLINFGTTSKFQLNLKSFISTIVITNFRLQYQTFL